MNELLDRLFEAGRRRTAVGYRGVRSEGENDHGVTGTEGNGVYIADDPHLASFFGDVKKVEYVMPKNPLVVNEEPLYLLHEMDELFDPITDDDTDWARANKEAIKRSGVTDDHWDPDKVAAELTNVIKGMGYDAVRVVSGGDTWIVLFDPKAVINQEPFEIGESVNEGLDKRYARWVVDRHRKLERLLASYNSGNSIAVAENETYRVEIHPDHQEYFILKSRPDKPVPAGSWMNFWDEDLEEVLGLTKEEYNKLEIKQRAEADAKVQLNKWVDIEYWMLYAEMYHVKDYDRWWWDEGGADFSAKNGIKATNEYWKKRLSGLREPIEEARLETQDEKGFSWTNSALKFVDEDYLPDDYDGGLYHVTTAKTRVRADGLKSRKQTKTVGLGGGYDDQDPGLVSVTFDEGHAQVIADRLQLAIKAAKGEVSNQEIFDQMDQDYNFLGDDPYDIAKALGAPEETYEDWDAFNKWIEDYDPYELLQDLDNALSSIYTEVEDFGYRVGLTADKSALAKLDPNEVEVLSVEARVGAKAKHVPNEAELRFRPEDIHVIR